MTHPYIYERQLERHAEDIRRAEQHRLARESAPQSSEPSTADHPASVNNTGLVRWNVWTRLFAGWPFRPLPVEPIR